MPVQRACRVVRLSRTAYYQPPVPASRRDAAVIAALTDAVVRYPRWGFWKLHDRLRAEGRPWNHKRLHRVYCALRLNLPRRTTRRVPRRVRQPLTAPPVLNRTWALDFMTETLYDRRRIRLLTVIDDRPIHVDHFLRARFDPRYAQVVYEASLLSKTILWAPEKEIRFLSKSQQKEIVIDGSIITRVILGPALRPSAAARIRRMAGCIPVVPRGAVPVTA